MKISDIINMAAYKVNKLTGSALSAAYTTLKSAFNKRVKVFQKHDAERALPKQFRNGMRSSLGMSDEEKLLAIKEASAFMRGSRSSYTGWKRSEIEQMDSLNDMLKGVFEFKTLDEFRTYGEFMGDMQTRLGEMWKNESSQVRELYFQSERLGVNVNQFLVNYEYWAEHTEKLQRAKPIEWSSSGRPVKTSDYARQLKLPSLQKFYRERYNSIMEEERLSGKTGKTLYESVMEKYRPISREVRKKK